jgi:hypothetical protein
MTTNIRNFLDNIDTNFPIQGRDNPSQGFRDNFAQIKLALVSTADELDNIVIANSTNTFTLTPATVSTIGGVKIGTGFRADPDGTIFIDEIYTLPTATPSVLGGVKIGSNISISDGVISVAAPFVLTTATGSVLGGVKVGYGLEIDNAGVLGINTATNFPFDIPIATSGVAGIVKIGANVSVSGDGTISVTAPYSLPPANTVTRGGVIIGANITVDNDGNISVAAPYVLPVATTSTLGGVIAGGGISIDGSGVISAPYSYTLPEATTSTPGGVVVGDNISVLNGVISVAAPYDLPTASNITKGGVKVGNGLTIDGGGFLNIETAPIDLSTVTQSILPSTDVAYDLGSPSYRWKDLYLSSSTIYLGGTSISAVNGVISIPSLSSSKLGVVAVGPVDRSETIDGDIRYIVDRDYFKNNPGVYGPFATPPVVILSNQTFYDESPDSKVPVVRVELDSGGYISGIVVDDPGYYPVNFSFAYVQDGISIEPVANEPITLLAKNVGDVPPSGGVYNGTFLGQSFTYTWDGNQAVGEEVLVGVNTTYGQLRTWRQTYGYYKFVGSNLVEIDEQEYIGMAASSPVLVVFGSADWSIYWGENSNGFPALNFTACEVGNINFTSATLATSSNLEVAGNATVNGSLTVNADITFADGTVLTSAIPTLPLYTTSTLNTIVSTATGAMVLVTDLVGGSLPCFYDGTDWKTFTGTII